MPEILYITGKKEDDALFDALSNLKTGRVNALTQLEIESFNRSPSLVVVKRKDLNKRLFKKIQSVFKKPPLLVLLSEKKEKVPAYLQESENVEIVYISFPEEICSVVSRVLLLRNVLNDYNRLKEENRELNRLINIQRELTKLMMIHDDLDSLFNDMMKSLKTVFNVKNWAVFIKDIETDEFVLTGASLKRKELKDVRLKPGDGVVGWVSIKKRPLVIDDLEGDVRARAEMKIHRVFKTSSMLVFPVEGRNSVVAVVELINKRKGDFTKDDLLLLGNILGHISVAVEKVMLQLRLEELVITDDLTKLFNLRYLNRTLDIELERANRYNTHVSLIFMDIDHFKDVNDTHGHLVGSKLLTEIAQLLLSRLRSVDIVARYGGDEFVIVLPQTSSKYAAMIAERLRKTVEEAVFLKKQGYNLKVTASFGVASYPDVAKSKEELLNLADEAMYKVKYKNRNGVYVII